MRQSWTSRWQKLCDSFVDRPPILGFVAALGIVLVVGYAYIRCLPFTVQSLDSGEMVSHAYLLQVPHPPGFPVYVWLTHVMTKGGAASSVFWRASFGACLCALTTLVAALAAGLHRKADAVHIFGAAAGLVLPLGLERVFWQYAITPDVFALHGATTALMFAAFFGMRPGFARAAAVSVAFTLGMANHPSTVFLAPLWWVALVDMHRLRHALSLVGGVVMGICALYATLWLMHPGAVDSWGLVDSLPRLWSHAIRADYGVLQLDGHRQVAHPIKNLGLLVRHIGWGTPLSCVLIGWSWAKSPRDPRLLWVLATLSMYGAVFFSLANTDDIHILERFMLMPHVGIMCAGVYAWCRVQKTHYRRWRMAGAAAACVLALAQLPQTMKDNDLSEDTVIEDYALNLLEMPLDDDTSVIVTDDDTRFNALRYAQNVLGVHPQTLVLTLGTALSTWGIEKRRWTHPAFIIAPRGSDPAEQQSFYTRVMLPNRARYTFYFTPHVNFPGFHTTYMGLGRALHDGAGASVDAVSSRRLRWRFEPSRLSAGAQTKSVASILYQDYCTYYQASARLQSSPQAMQAALVDGAAQMPLCVQVLQTMCQGMPAAQACRRQLEKLSVAK